MSVDFQIEGIPFVNSESFWNELSQARPGFAISILRHTVSNFLDAKDHIVAHTSGSTGPPKEIHISKEHVINSCNATCDFFKLEPRMTIWLCLPLDFIAGKMVVYRAMTRGLNLLIDRPEVSELAKSKRSNIDFAAMVPTQVHELLMSNSSIFKPVSQLIIGGAPVSMRIEKLLLNLSVQAYETYGMTETVSHVALRKMGQGTFTALPNVKFVDRNGQLEIIAPHISDSPILTNDVTELVDEYHFKWLGRLDNVLNSGGVKIHPEKIEKLISESINREVIAFGQKNEKYGEVLCVLIESKDEVAIHLPAQLSQYERPKEIFYLSEFVRTPRGKLLRDATLKLAFANRG